MGIQYQPQLPMLSIHKTSTTRQSTAVSLATVAGRIRTQVTDAYCRDLKFHQRIKYVQTYLMAKALYTAQVLPLPTYCLRK
jgi:hypothetical protein